MIYRLLDRLPEPSWPFIGLLLATAIVATLCIEAGRRILLRHKIRELENEAQDSIDLLRKLAAQLHDAQALICAYIVRDEKLTRELAEAFQECVEIRSALLLSQKLNTVLAIRVDTAEANSAELIRLTSKRPARRKVAQ